ncbi:MAG: hypothetical protein P4L84_33070 [Isosphaeraceae bacterium]|nr:hypothetical protein [Isosphaeraceae bacterium]
MTELVTVLGPGVPSAGDVLLAKLAPGGRWVSDFGRAPDCDHPYLCFMFGDCGGTLADVTVTMTPKGGGTPRTATSDATGHACFNGHYGYYGSTLVPGDYTASYTVPSGYTAPPDEEIKVGLCNSPVAKLIYPAPGMFKLSPGSAPQPAPGSLSLTTPFSTVSLQLFRNYPGQQDGNYDYDNALLGWWGYEDGPSYTWTSVNPDGTIEQSCNVHNRVAYSVYDFSCGSFVLYWYMWRCFDSAAGGDPGFIPCGPSCFTPGPIGSGTAPAVAGGDFYFFQYGLANTGIPFGGFVPNGYPASGYTRAQNESPDGTIYIDFGAAGSLFNSISASPCGTVGSGPPGPPVGWCAGLDAVIISTWHMTSLVNPPTNEPPANAQPVDITLVLTL